MSWCSAGRGRRIISCQANCERSRVVPSRDLGRQNAYLSADLTLTNKVRVTYCPAVNVQESAVYCPKKPLTKLAAGFHNNSTNSVSRMVCIGIAPGRSVPVSLAQQVLLSKVRKEAALDLHSPFSTSHNKPFRQPDWPLASPFLTSYPLPLLNCGPRNGAAFFASGTDAP